MHSATVNKKDLWSFSRAVERPASGHSPPHSRRSVTKFSRLPSMSNVYTNNGDMNTIKNTREKTSLAHRQGTMTTSRMLNLSLTVTQLLNSMQ